MNFRKKRKEFVVQRLPLIALITARKAYDAINRDGRQKRGGGAVRANTVM